MTLASGYEPRFDRDYAYGREAEQLTDDILNDIAAGGYRVENKRKRRMDDTYYVEVEHDPHRRGDWKPSGLAVTEAEWWSFQAGSSWIVWWPTELLRLAAAHPAAVWKSTRNPENDNPTRGWLLKGRLLRQLAEEEAA